MLKSRTWKFVHSSSLYQTKTADAIAQLDLLPVGACVILALPAWDLQFHLICSPGSHLHLIKLLSSSLSFFYTSLVMYIQYVGAIMKFRGPQIIAEVTRYQMFVFLWLVISWIKGFNFFSMLRNRWPLTFPHFFSIQRWKYWTLLPLRHWQNRTV